MSEEIEIHLIALTDEQIHKLHPDTLNKMRVVMHLLDQKQTIYATSLETITEINARLACER